jgi:hypothetical protein
MKPLQLLYYGSRSYLSSQSMSSSSLSVRKSESLSSSTTIFKSREKTLCNVRQVINFPSIPVLGRTTE